MGGVEGNKKEKHKNKVGRKVSCSEVTHQEKEEQQ